MNSKAIVGYVIVLVVVLGGGYAAYRASLPDAGDTKTVLETNVPATTTDDERRVAAATEYLSDLTVPWDVAFLPDSSLLITERDGTLLHVTDIEERALPIPEVAARGEGGLLGMALHPDFAQNRYVYLYHTTVAGNQLTNRVVRYEFTDGELREPVIIIDAIPGASYHDGGRIAFGPDGYLYITTGDAGNEDHAQARESLAGKILRLTDAGEVPADNPFGSAVYSYGHRNPQGLAWDASGQLWATEHGRSGIRSGFDEFNRIEAGGNYGWPDSEGDEVAPGTIGPVLHSGANETWAPASLVFLDGRLFFGGLRGEALYEVADLSAPQPTLTTHFKSEYGRIRTVTTDPEGTLYFTTSNRDGRGSAAAADDRLLQVQFE